MFKISKNNHILRLCIAITIVNKLRNKLSVPEEIKTLCVNVYKH